MWALKFLLPYSESLLTPKLIAHNDRLSRRETAQRFDRLAAVGRSLHLPLMKNEGLVARPQEPSPVFVEYYCGCNLSPSTNRAYLQNVLRPNLGGQVQLSILSRAYIDAFPSFDGDAQGILSHIYCYELKSLRYYFTGRSCLVCLSLKNKRKVIYCSGSWC